MEKFICPICRQPLSLYDKAYKCCNRHSYDISKYGYVNLLMSQKSSKKRHGDDKLMIRSRQEFLNKGYYEPLLKCITEIVSEKADGRNISVLDAGCGDCYYSSFVKENIPTCEMYGVDISKDAFSGGYLYSEISRDEFREIYLSWTRLIPRLEMIVAFKDGVAAGFSMGYINPQNPADYISKTTAVRREFQHNKLYLALVYLGYKHIIGLGYSDVVYHFECEQRSTFRRFDSNTESNEKRYAVFVKELDA